MAACGVAVTYIRLPLHACSGLLNADGAAGEGATELFAVGGAHLLVRPPLCAVHGDERVARFSKLSFSPEWAGSAPSPGHLLVIVELSASAFEAAYLMQVGSL